MVFGTGFHSLNNEIHSDNQVPVITASLSIGGSLESQYHQNTTITVTITLTDDEGQPEQVGNFIAGDIFPSNCVVESFAMHDNYTKYTFNLRSIIHNDGTNLCSGTLAAGVFSDKANSPSPSRTISWYPDTVPPSPTIEFTNLSQFTHHVNDFGGDVGAGTAWPPYDGGSLLGNEYYAATSPIDIDIYMNEIVIGFNPAIHPTGHVHIDNGASWVTLPTTTDNIRWTGQLNIQPGITTMVINAGQFQDRAQNNTNSAINNNDDGPGSRSVSYDTTAPTIQSDNLYAQNNSTNIGNNARTNDDFVYLHITLSEADTNFDTRSMGTLFNTTNCTISEMTHVSGNTFRVKITPNSSGNPFTQCEFSLNSNTFMDRSQNTGPPSAGSSGGGTSWIWQHDDIVPTVTFTFTDGTVGSSDGSNSPNTTSFIATGNVTGVLNFSEDVLNVGTGNIEETSIPLGTASSVSGSGSNYTWTFSGIPAATTAMSPTPLVFKYNHGSVTDLGGSAVSPTPSNIYVEYGDPVPVTMLFDTNNDNFGTDSTTNMTYFKVIFDMIEPYTGTPRFHFTTDGTTVMNPSPAGSSGGGSIFGSNYRYHYTLTSIWPATANTGTAILVWDTNPLQIANTAGKYIQPPPNITWTWNQSLTPTFLFEDPNGTNDVGALTTINYNYPTVIVDFTVAVTPNFNGGGDIDFVGASWIASSTDGQIGTSTKWERTLTGFHRPPMPNSGSCQVELDATGVNPTSNTNIEFADPSPPYPITWNWDFTIPNISSHTWITPSSMNSAPYETQLTTLTVMFTFSPAISVTNTQLQTNLQNNTININNNITITNVVNVSNIDYYVTFTIPSVSTDTTRNFEILGSNFSTSFGQVGNAGLNAGWTQKSATTSTLTWYFGTADTLKAIIPQYNGLGGGYGGGFAGEVSGFLTFSDTVTGIQTDRIGAGTGWTIVSWAQLDGTGKNYSWTLRKTGSEVTGINVTDAVYFDSSSHGGNVTDTAGVVPLDANLLRLDFTEDPIYDVYGDNPSLTPHPASPQTTTQAPTLEFIVRFNYDPTISSSFSTTSFKNALNANATNIANGLNITDVTFVYVIANRYGYKITLDSPTANGNLYTFKVEGLDYGNYFNNYFGAASSITSQQLQWYQASLTNITCNFGFDTTGNNVGDSTTISTRNDTVDIIIEFSQEVSGAPTQSNFTFTELMGIAPVATFNPSIGTPTMITTNKKWKISTFTFNSGEMPNGQLAIYFNYTGITPANTSLYQMGNVPTNIYWVFNKGFYLRYLDAGGIMGDFVVSRHTTTGGNLIALAGSMPAAWNSSTGEGLVQKHMYYHTNLTNEPGAGPNGPGAGGTYGTWMADQTDTGTSYDFAIPMQHVGCGKDSGSGNNARSYDNFTSGHPNPSIGLGSSTHPGVQMLNANDFLLVSYWYTNGSVDTTSGSSHIPHPSGPSFWYYNNAQTFDNAFHQHSYGSTSGGNHSTTDHWSDNHSGSSTAGNGPSNMTYGDQIGNESGYSCNFHTNFTQIPSWQRPTVTHLQGAYAHHPWFSSTSTSAGYWQQNWYFYRAADILANNFQSSMPLPSATSFARQPRGGWLAMGSCKAHFQTWVITPPAGGWKDFGLGYPFLYMVFRHEDLD